MNFLILNAAAITVLVSLMATAVGEDSSVRKSPLPCQRGQAVVKTPESGIEKPGDIGKRAHTNVEILVPSCPPQTEAQPDAGASGQTPTQDATPPR